MALRLRLQAAVEEARASTESWGVISCCDECGGAKIRDKDTRGYFLREARGSRKGDRRRVMAKHSYRTLNDV